MSRRVLTPRPAAAARAGQRMAPGGRLWSESPIRPFSRPIGEAGDEPEVEPPPLDPYLRPVSISGGNLIGGAGNNTLRDQSDLTYARLDRNPHSGTLIATFETRALTFTPTSARIQVRARSLVPVPNSFYLVWTLARSIPAGGVPASGKYCGLGTTDFTHPDFGGGIPLTPQNGDTFHEMSAGWSNGQFGKYFTPTVADVAGGIQVFFDAATSVASPEGAGATFQCDIADVWLELT